MGLITHISVLVQIGFCTYILSHISINFLQNQNMLSCLKLPQLDLFQSQKHLKDFKECVRSMPSVLYNLGNQIKHLKRLPLYLPIYPRVNGRTLSVQGDKLVTSPAPKITAKLHNRKVRKRYGQEA